MTLFLVFTVQAQQSGLRCTTTYEAVDAVGDVGQRQLERRVSDGLLVRDVVGCFPARVARRQLVGNEVWAEGVDHLVVAVEQADDLGRSELRGDGCLDGGGRHCERWVGLNGTV